jgi:hypothetical protein
MKMRSDFFASLPRLDELVDQYGVEPGIVFHMCRAPLRRTIVVSNRPHTRMGTDLNHVHLGTSCDGGSGRQGGYAHKRGDTHRN